MRRDARTLDSELNGVHVNESLGGTFAGVLHLLVFSDTLCWLASSLLSVGRGGAGDPAVRKGGRHVSIFSMIVLEGGGQEEMGRHGCHASEADPKRNDQDRTDRPQRKLHNSDAMGLCYTAPAREGKGKEGKQ